MLASENHQIYAYPTWEVVDKIVDGGPRGEESG